MMTSPLHKYSPVGRYIQTIVYKVYSYSIVIPSQLQTAIGTF